MRNLYYCSLMLRVLNATITRTTQWFSISYNNNAILAIIYKSISKFKYFQLFLPFV